ncbi:MAG: anti-sigma factor [Burkholderiaceae bacterium]|nr:anti-sigma factor [Burkholderiaceae bacterium]
MSISSVPQAPDDLQLSAWLDGELDPAAAAEVQAWLNDHPDDAARVRLWAADRDALRARLDPMVDEPLPEALRQQVLHGRPAMASAPRRLPLAWAAGLLLAGGVLGGLIGAGVVWQWPAAEQVLAQRGWAAEAIPTSGWTRRAAVAHAVYVPERRHPVEVSVAEGDAAAQRAQEEHLVRWLSRRLDMPVMLYDLSRFGYALVGGRLLPDASGPSAQLMYQDGTGQRITIYLRKPEPGASMAFRYQREGELGLFYWIDEGFGCALVGRLPKDRLLALAEAVYQQAEAAPARPPASAPAPAARASGPLS